MSIVYERTIAQPVSHTGIGLHSGAPVTLTLRPGAASTGIVFERADLTDASGAPRQLAMQAGLIQDTLMSSNLVDGDLRIGTIEHLLSAVAAMGIDNLVIAVSSAEMPIMDGSAIEFVKLIERAGIREQDRPKSFIKIIKHVEVVDGDKWARLEPCDERTGDGFVVDFTIDFDHPVIKAGGEHYRFVLGSQAFVDEIACARTFGFVKDLDYLKVHNLAQGGSLDNAVVLTDDGVMNPEGLRFVDEFVRHKILDAIGDVYVIGSAILGKMTAYKSGHALNNRLIREVMDDPSTYEIVTNCEKEQLKIAYAAPKI